MQNPVNQLDYRILISYGFLKSDLTGARTQDPLLKREMLYQLSYQVFKLCLAVWLSGCKYNINNLFSKMN